MASHHPASNLSYPLSIAPNEAACITIWESFFGRPTSPNNVVAASAYKELFTGYFQNLYKNELEKLMRGYKEQNWALAHLAITTHQGLLDVVKDLEASARRNAPKYHLISDLKARYSPADERAVEDSIDLAVRVRFMINTRNLESQARSQAEPLKWRLDQTLGQFLTTVFPHATWQPEGRDSRLSPLFRAAYMVDVCGLELEETSYLHEHLQLKRLEKKNVLKYFPYKSCLHALDIVVAEYARPFVRGQQS